MWADNETTLDLLGFEIHAELIKSVVTDTQLLPITVGVFGDWGSGKTSIMRMLEKEIITSGKKDDDSGGVVCIYFNGWLFEGYDDAKSALLTAILKELDNKKKIDENLRDKFSQLMQSVDWMRLTRFGFEKIAFPAVAAYFTGGTSLIPTVLGAGKSFLDELKTAGGDLSKMNMGWDEILKKDGINHEDLGVKQFRERFSELLEETNIESLVILVDDLDRCTPQRIIDNLEAIKLFLSVDKTAFVIGADPRIVEYAISSVYGTKNIPSSDGKMGNEDFIKDYLEKLIQVPYHLPRLSPAEVQTYMSLLFCYQDMTKENFETIYKAYRKHYQEDRYRVFGFGDINSIPGITLSENLTKNLTFCASVSNAITEGLKGNPRQIKRFLNAFILRKKLADVANLPDFKDDVLVKLMVLEYAKSTLFERLFVWQAEQDGFPKQLEILENFVDNEKFDFDDKSQEELKSWLGDFPKKWLSVEPHLSTVDLRDYFWVARDRLQSTLSSVTMVSPFLRNILVDLISGETKKVRNAVTQVAELGSDDLDELFYILKQHVLKHPEELGAYKGILELIANNVSNSTEFFSEILISVPSKDIPPSLGVMILILISKDQQVEEILRPTIEKLKETETSIAEALKTKRE